MDTRGSPERFPDPTDGSVESLFRLIPSSEGQRKLWQILELLHPADARTFVKNLLRMSPAPALQTQPEPLRRDCDTVVAALVESLFRLVPSPEEEQRGLWQILESLHSAYARTFLDNLLQYNVEYSDYSACDGYDELYCCSGLCGGVGPPYYAPTDMAFVHELHGPDDCGVYCQLRCGIGSYGHCAPTDGELSHGMNEPANYDPVPGKISPESGSMMAMSDFADDIDAEPGEPFLPSGFT